MNGIRNLLSTDSSQPYLVILKSSSLNGVNVVVLSGGPAVVVEGVSSVEGSSSGGRVVNSSSSCDWTPTDRKNTTKIVFIFLLAKNIS